VQDAHPCTVSASYGAILAQRGLADGQVVPRPSGEGRLAQQCRLGEEDVTVGGLQVEPVRSAAADGRSADRSASLQLSLLFFKAGLRAAACGGRPRPAGATPQAYSTGRSLRNP